MKYCIFESHTGKCFVLLLLSVIFMSQNIYAQDYYLKTQALVDDFDSTITHVQGSIVIGRFEQNDTSIENLLALKNIRHISGSLVINICNALENLDGLDKLEYVGGGVSITQNCKLHDLSGLTNLNRIEGELFVRELPQLLDFSGLGALEYIGSLRVEQNDTLQNFSGLQTLEIIGEDLRLIGCKELKNLYGLSKLDTIGGSFWLSGHDKLLSLDGLDNLKSINSTFNWQKFISISSCDTLQNIDALKNIENFGGRINVSHNPYLKDLAGFANLNYVANDFIILSNPGLTQLSELKRLTHINGSLEIDSNHELIDVSGLDSLVTIGDDLLVTNNILLADCCPFKNLISDTTRVGGNIIIENNNTGCFNLMEITSDINCPEDSITTTVTIGNITFLSQAEVNAFDPNITTINGDLKIGALNMPTDITDLSPLANIHTVNGSLGIYSNENLETLDGLNIYVLRQGLYVNENNKLREIDAISSAKPNSLEILSNAKLEQIRGLSKVTNLIGLIRIRNNASLINLDGLDNLVEVDGSIWIQYNESLVDINALAKLETVGTGFQINDNPSLTKIHCLKNYKGGGLSFYIYDNESLESIDSLSQFQSIRDLTISENLNLHSIQGMEALEEVRGDFRLIGNTALFYFAPMIKLESIGERLTVKNCNSLVDLSAFQSLESLHELFINDNLNLETLHGLHNVKGSVYAIEIESNPLITNLNGLVSVGEIYSALVLSNNELLNDLEILANKRYGYRCSVQLISLPLLADLTAFRAARELGSFVFIDLPLIQDMLPLSDLSSLYGLTIINLPQLKNLDPLTSVYRLEYLKVESNPELESIDGLIYANPYFGSLIIKSNNKLETFNELSRIEFIESSMVIEDNAVLKNIDGLSSLKGVSFNAQDFIIRKNPRLKNVDALSNLTFFFNQNNEWVPLYYDLEISENDSLENLNGLSNLTDLEYMDLYIRDNPRLTDCCGIRQLLTDPNAVMGEIIIENNPSACSSTDEVLTSCFSTAEDIEIEQFCIFPNPATDWINIDLNQSYSYEIFSCQGALCSSGSINEFESIDISKLGVGLYFINCTTSSNRNISLTFIK